MKIDVVIKHLLQVSLSITFPLTHFNVLSLFSSLYFAHTPTYASLYLFIVFFSIYISVSRLFLILEDSPRVGVPSRVGNIPWKPPI